MKSEDTLKIALDQSIPQAFASESLAPRHSSVPTLKISTEESLDKEKSFIPATNPLAGKIKHTSETIKQLQNKR